MVVTTAERRMMTEARPMPACPTTQLRRMNSITPQMFRIQRIWERKGEEREGGREGGKEGGREGGTDGRGRGRRRERSCE